MTKKEYEKIKKTFFEEYVNKQHTKEVLTIENDLENQIKEYPFSGELSYYDKDMIRALWNIDFVDVLRRDYPFLEFESEFDFRGCEKPQACYIRWREKE
mgnify:CR=1 FL=1